MAEGFNFKVSNEDIRIKFSCPNHKDRIDKLIRNLGLNESGDYEKKTSRFSIDEGDAVFSFNGEERPGKDIRQEAVFFENTDYPLIIKGNNKELDELSISINDRLQSGKEGKSSLNSDGGEIYGSINFHNQVGLTDFKVRYKVKGETTVRTLKFTTEVLSYKLDYRSDLKSIISDIENEYALLSASFLKDTYLGMRSSPEESSPLVWWQIFKSCYKEIIQATRDIIERPKRRLRPVVKYEGAERLRTLPPELENEYHLHKDNPAYLYHTEEMVLSHDTIENRFLKHVINEMLRKFGEVKQHIITSLHLDSPMDIHENLDNIENELLQLQNNSFFRGVGIFKGFSQDSLVMKQAHGYKTIMARWIELQQGYELEEGMRKLEVKEISDLYEIWCFIKVKNIVRDILKDKAGETSNGRSITNDFIPKLIYGGSVSFINTNNVELASVSYNPEVKGKTSYIEGTNTLTTTQRPDVVLRITKTEDSGMKYTYLFDAKYRINDNRIEGQDVPPEDSINQMHRYRDAIYYIENGTGKEYLKKEIIGGYVLFPGKVNMESLHPETGDYHYLRSNRNIGIGAFPLRPEHREINPDGTLKINPYDSETALREQIKKWIEESSRENLLESSIPQKGLEYSDEPVTKGNFFIHSIDTHVNPDKKLVEEGQGEGKIVLSGYKAFSENFALNNLKYFVPVIQKGKKLRILGYYKIDSLTVVDARDAIITKKNKLKAEGEDEKFTGHDQPIRLSFHLGNFTSLTPPMIYGIKDSLKGRVMKRKQFFQLPKEK